MATYSDWNLLDCADCLLEPRPDNLNGDVPVDCSHCGKRVMVRVFPVIMKKDAPGPVADSTIIGAESSCYYHPEKKAARICDDCGRFLCDLCDVEFQGRHVCTACLANVSTTAAAPAAGARFVRYDSLALLWAVGGLVFWFFSFITASTALYYAIRHWRTPLSVLPRRRWRFVVAASVALLTLGAWSVFILQLFPNATP